MLGLLFRGILLGIGAAVPIGPVNVEIARRTLRFGVPAGFVVGCGAVTVDVGYAIFTSLGMRPLLLHPALQTALAIAGSALLLYLAWGCLRGAVRQWRGTADETADAPVRRRTGYLTGLFMTLLNPMTLAFWFVAVPGFVGQITDAPRRDLPIVCAGVFLGAFGWVCGFTLLLGRLRRARNDTLFALTDALGGVLLLAFAVLTATRLLS